MTEAELREAVIHTGRQLQPLDPQVREFATRMAADAARHPRRDTVPIAQGRAIAEEVRAPWTEGGPVMASTTERRIPTRHGEVLLRIYTPAQRKTAGGMFYIHGGGFVLFSIDTHDRLMREYAERAGMVVVGINYTLAPEARFPQPIEECVDAATWIAAHAEELGIDPALLFIAGDSAGGNLSLNTCMVLRDEGRQLMRGMVLNYTGFSTNVFRDSVVRYGGGDHGLSLHMMVWFYRNYLRGPEDYTDPRMNLLAADLHDLPPVFQVITECDPLLDDALDMVEKMKDAGLDVDAKVYPGTIHSFLEAVSIADIAGVAFDDTVRWMQSKS